MKPLERQLSEEVLNGACILHQRQCAMRFSKPHLFKRQIASATLTNAIRSVAEDSFW